MRDDICAAACRLMASCPVHTHERKPPPPPDRAHFGTGNRGRGITVIFGKGGKARPIKIGRMTFVSATEAARTLRKSTGKIYEWLRDGTARYA